MLRRSLALLILALALAGCSGGTTTSAGGGAAGAPAPLLLDTATATVTAAGGGTVASDLGHQVVFPPGSLSQSALVTLRVLSGALEAPASEEFQPLGHFLQVDLGGARLVGPAQIGIQGGGLRPDTTVMTWRVQGVSIPLDTAVADGVATGVLEGQPESLGGAPIQVGLVDTSAYESRPAHQDWPSYNLYEMVTVIEPNKPAKTEFVKVVDQGTPVGTIGPLGAKPLLIVHGLGSSIHKQEFVDLALYLQQNSGYTSILGFEYDTLNGIADNGQFLNQAYVLLNGLSSGLTWHHAAHSMGSLVSRSALEKTTLPAIAPSGNRLLTICGPHLGSPIIDVIQGKKNLAQRFVLYLVMNHVMEFTNADGTPCKVTGLEEGFTDLRPDSAFLAALNPGAAGNHPQFDYNTVGGDYRGVEFDGLDFVAYGIHTSEYLDDGLVDLVSANPTIIGAQSQAVIDESHTGAITDSGGYPTIDALLDP